MNRITLKLSFGSRLVLTVPILVFVKEQMQIHGCDVMRELIELKVRTKSWTFNEISNLKSSIEAISHEIYSEMNLVERFQLVKEIKINDGFVGMYYTDVLKQICMSTISAEVAGTIRDLLDGATVDFGGNKNEVSENGLVRESDKERPADEKEEDGKQE